MKKNLILANAVAAVVAIAAGQVQMLDVANAAGKGGGREARPKGVLEAETREAKEAAATSGRAGAEKSPTSTALAEIKSQGLNRNLSPNEMTDLGRLMTKNPEVLDAVKGALAQAKNEATRELAMARIEGLARSSDLKTGEVTDSALATLSADARIELAYSNLLINAGKQAEGWSPELRGNLTFLLQKTNELRAQGRSIVDAMKEANELMSRPTAKGGRDVRLNLEEINKLCKKIKA